MTDAGVWLWGRRMGAVSVDEPSAFAAFEYDRDFARSGLEVSPLRMPLGRRGIFRFSGLNPETFHGVPGLLSDSLPDRWGNALIAAWLARQGRQPESFDAVERLCYTGERGIGALEYQPATGPQAAGGDRLDMVALVDLAAEALHDRIAWTQDLGSEKEVAMKQILRVGTSAGGARAKALIALEPETLEVRSGQGEVPQGFEHWILKFDGVSGDAAELSESHGYGLVEYVYSQMARLAGIEMSETRVLPEGPRNHFMTRRFDRTADGGKLHMQSLGAIAHLDFNLPGANAYEQAFQAIRRLGLGRDAIDQQLRRMLFNVVARNQDDHVKNIAFLMDLDGRWSLSPAFDLTYADGKGPTAQHQMSINGIRNGFTLEDFVAVEEVTSSKRGHVKRLLGEVVEAVSKWPELASGAGISQERAQRIGARHRLGPWPPR